MRPAEETSFQFGPMNFLDVAVSFQLEFLVGSVIKSIERADFEDGPSSEPPLEGSFIDQVLFLAAG